MNYDLGIPELDDQIDGIDAGTNLLVMGPSMSGKDSFAFSVLSAGIEAGEGSIYVTTKYSGEEVMEEFEDAGIDPERFGVVDCVSQNQGMSQPADSANIKLTSSPNDMTGIGIKVSELLEEFLENKGIEQNRICLNSVSTLLMYSNLQTVFRFLHVFTGRIRSADALGIFLIDSEMHDQQEYSTLKQLFDGVVETRAGDGGNEARVTGLGGGNTDWFTLQG